MNILIKLINDVKVLCNTIITAVNAIKAKTDTITASVITQAQANNLDATISSRQANAGFTTTHSSRIDASISSRATQTTVDAIKAKTDSLGSDLLKHPFCDFQQSNTTAANNNLTYTTFKTISGKGRINNIMFKLVSGGNVRAKIFIDGNLAFEGLIISEGASESPCGIALFSDLKGITSGSSFSVRIAIPVSPFSGKNNIQHFPENATHGLRNRSWGQLISSGYSSGVLFSHVPIEFKSSVIIQFANENANISTVNIYSSYDLDY